MNKGFIVDNPDPDSRGIRADHRSIFHAPATPARRPYRPSCREPVSIWLFAAFALAGCASDDAATGPSASDLSRRYVEEGRQLFALRPTAGGGTGRPGSAAAEPTASELEAELQAARDGGTSDRVRGPRSNRKGWSVLVLAISGEGHQAKASSAAQRLAASGLAGAFVEPRDNGSAVLFGEFDDPSSKAAQSALHQVRGLNFAGGMPFGSAMMVAPPEQEAATNDPADLRNARRGPGNPRYTWQVGIYRRTDKQKPSAEEVAEFRRNAEAAARALRAQGEQAFYYHSATASTVTVGLFAEPPSAVQEAEMRRRFPYNLVNGLGVKERGQAAGTAERRERMQPSFAVEIPQ